MLKNKNVLLLGVAVLATSGCSSVLYSGNNAPIYDRTGGVQKTASTDSSSTSTVEWKTTSQTTTPAVTSEPFPIETQPTVTNNTTSPYETASIEQAGSGMSDSAQGAVEDVSSNSGFSNQTLGTVETQNSPFQNSEIVNSNDPRIKSASELTAPKTLPADQSVTLRPEPVETKETETVVKQQEEKVSTPKVEEKVEKPKSEPIRPTKPEPVAEPVEQVAKKTVAEPVASSGSAVKDLLNSAKKAVSSGDYEKAASELERAHRIKPGDAKILYDIAQVRFAQGKYSQAESFASRAASVAGSNSLKKKIWTLLSKARKALGNSSGAASALKKANQF